MRHFPAGIFLTLFLLLPGPAQNASAQQPGPGGANIVFPDDSVDPLATLHAGHPRLLATAEDFDRIARTTDDPLRAEAIQRTIGLADSILQEPLIGYQARHASDELGQSKMAIQTILTTAMAYRLTHDRRYAGRAVSEMLNVSRFPNWCPDHFIDVSDMAMAVAIGYDWCYDAMSSDDRAVVRRALIEKALSFAPAIYGPKATRQGALGPRFWFPLSPYSWNQVCNSGMLAAALALADEKPEKARQVVQGVRAYLPLAMHSYAPDGAWVEGPWYWDYGTTSNVLALAMLKSSLGTDFGLGKVEPAFGKTGMFRLQLESPSGVVYNFSDCVAARETGINPVLGWLAKAYGPPALAAQFRELLANQFATQPEAGDEDRFFALHALWIPPAPTESGAAPLDAHFGGLADMAIFRSAWRDSDALYLCFKNGRNGVSHDHLDLGSFLLDSDGVRWSASLGSDDYDLPQYFGNLRWNYFRLNNHGQSTLTPGNRLQSINGFSSIFFYQSTPEQAWAVADLTAAYPGSAKKIIRAVFLQHRARVFMQDNVIGLAANTPLNWRMVTPADIDISEDGHTATLTQKQKTLRVELLSPANGKFSVQPATPPTAAENQNEGYSVLQAQVPATDSVSDVRLAVLLTPVGPKWPTNLPAPQLVPLSK